MAGTHSLQAEGFDACVAKYSLGPHHSGEMATT